MGIVLALASATCFGIADFLGGILSRKANSASVALFGQLAGAILPLAYFTAIALYLFATRQELLTVAVVLPLALPGDPRAARACRPA